MRHQPAAVTVLVLAAFLTGSCAMGRIPVTEKDVDLLMGGWAGSHERRSPDGTLQWQERVELEIIAVSAGRLTRGAGSWTVPLTIRDGRVFFMFEGEERGFALKQQSEGGLVLEASYYTESAWGGHRIGSISLKKTGKSRAQ